MRARCSLGDIRGVLENLIKDVGLWPGEIEVASFQEDVVELPVPSWVSAYACDDYPGQHEAEITAAFCLRSEIPRFRKAILESIDAL